VGVFGDVGGEDDAIRRDVLAVPEEDAGVVGGVGEVDHQVVDVGGRADVEAALVFADGVEGVVDVAAGAVAAEHAHMDGTAAADDEGGLEAAVGEPAFPLRGDLVGEVDADIAFYILEEVLAFRWEDVERPVAVLLGKQFSFEFEELGVERHWGRISTCDWRCNCRGLGWRRSCRRRWDSLRERRRCADRDG
jgi:hypothetical protein